MSKLARILRPGGWIDRVLVACVGAVWLWKIGEYIGRVTGVLRRNLGWGFYVDATIPVALTVAASLCFIIRWVAGPQSSAKDGHHRSGSD